MCKMCDDDAQYGHLDDSEKLTDEQQKQGVKEDCAAFGDALSDVFECDPDLKAQMIERGLITSNQ